ncbi:MAG: hypothetical protein NT091_05015 [Candidatus Falkowbacteria bacterium]|nr:hypothetical protein [Candidatus Falkowbacteria bacterium]
MLNENNLFASILQVITYHDLFDYPLTNFEIWQKISIKTSLIDTINTLKKPNHLIQEKQGFYFLTGREQIVITRYNRYNYTFRKIKLAKIIAHIFKYISSIELIAVGNLIGAHNLKDESDIDFFIITKPNTLWVTRFITTSIVKALNLRPTQKNQRDKICLSFFITNNNLNLENIKLNPNDLYLTGWLSNLFPIYDKNNIYNCLIKNNPWLHTSLPNWEPSNSSPQFLIKETFTIFPLELLKLFETPLKKFQLKMFPIAIKELMNQDTRVIINDQMLKFHVNDRRKMYQEKFEAKWKNLKEA